MKITGKTKEQIIHENIRQIEIQELLKQEKENFKKAIYILIKNSYSKLNKTEQAIVDKWLTAFEKLSRENLI